MWSMGSTLCLVMWKWPHFKLFITYFIYLYAVAMSMMSFEMLRVHGRAKMGVCEVQYVFIHEQAVMGLKKLQYQPGKPSILLLFFVTINGVISIPDAMLYDKRFIAFKA